MDETSSKEWSEGTTFRQGRERDLEDYEGYLGFKRKSLEGKTILDLGSGEAELFSKELKESGVNAKVINLNPDYSNKSYREKPINRENSVAAIGQLLPFKNNSFDKIFSCYSLTAFVTPDQRPRAAKLWAEELARVLKPKGEAILSPVFAIQKQDLLNQYKILLTWWQNNGIKTSIEKINSEKLGLEKAQGTYQYRIRLYKL